MEPMTPMLTQREQQVLQLVAESYTSKEIADKLYLSKRTIDMHRASLLTKLDARNAAMLVKRSLDMGLIK